MADLINWPLTLKNILCLNQKIFVAASQHLSFNYIQLKLKISYKISPLQKYDKFNIFLLNYVKL